MLTRLVLALVLLSGCRGTDSGPVEGTGNATATRLDPNTAPSPTEIDRETTHGIPPTGSGLGPGYVVWESNRTGTWRLWIRELDGAEPRQLTPDEDRRIQCCPHISPDGQSIVYLSLPPSQKLYPEGGAVGRLDRIRPDGSSRSTVRQAARNYFENRAVVWRSPSELIYLEPDGSAASLDLESGITKMLTQASTTDIPWLVDRQLSWAVSGIGGFGELEPGTGRVAPRLSLPGCQPYFSNDGRWVFWVQAPGGPIVFRDLATGDTRTLLKKSDPRLPPGRGYLYFPMLSSDSRLLAYGASPDEFNHFESDYDIFVIETEPSTLEILSAPVRITHDPATDRFPDVWSAPLPLGRFEGEAPFEVRFEAPDRSGRSWTWDFGDGSTTQGTPVEHRFDTAGSFEVQATTGNVTLRGRVVVDPPAPPEVASLFLRNRAREVVVIFNEAVDIGDLEPRLESGIAVTDSALDRQNRRLRLSLQEPILEPDRLILVGIRDQAQNPNRIDRLELELEPPFWPTSQAGLLFLMQTADAANLVYDANLGGDTAIQIRPQGAARLSPRFALLPAGGYFRASERDAERIVEGARRTYELTLEAVIQPYASQSRRTGVLVASGPPRRFNFALEQRRQRLVFVAQTRRSRADPPTSATLFPLPMGRQSHVVVTYQPGRLVGYLDGERRATLDSLPKGFHHWRSGALTIGADDGGHNPWHGLVEGLAIYSRVLEQEEVRENYRRYQTLLESREPMTTWRVRATVERCSATPRPTEIQPYRQALSVCLYTVNEVLQGEDLGPRLRVARWSVLDGRPRDPAMESEPIDLQVSRYSDNPQLQALYLSDTLSDVEDLTLFYGTRP